MSTLAVELPTDPADRDAWHALAEHARDSGDWHALKALCEKGLDAHLTSPLLHKRLIDAISALASLDAAYTRYQLTRVDSHPVEVQPNEVLAFVCVRNERPRLPYLLDYYRRLGVHRFFFVDNESTDGSAGYLEEQADVHLWTSTLPFNQANFGSSWFELLQRRYAVGHWCLTVDCDEFLYFEGAPRRPLTAFCRYLELAGKEAASGIFLDMYSDLPIRDTHYLEGMDPLALCPWFDRKFHHRLHLMAGEYRNQNLYFGGVRQRVFPTEKGHILSKVVLQKYRPERVLSAGQHLSNVPADQLVHEQVCVLHFKFFSTLPAHARTEAAREIHSVAALQYKAYQQALNERDDLCLYDNALSLRFEGAAQLRRIGALEPEQDISSGHIPRIAPPRPGQEQRPFWSVMVTVFDRTEHLERVLGSLLPQVDEHLQLTVVCDLKSPQRQVEIAATVEELGNGRVEFHAAPERLGQPGIFNECLELARGEWVHILHDDDWVAPDLYRSLEPALRSSPRIGAALVRHRIIATDSVNPHTWDSWLERETAGIVDGWSDRIAVQCRPQFSAMIVRRTVYAALGGFRDDAASAFDWEMWARIGLHHPLWFDPAVRVFIGRDDSALTSELRVSGGQIEDARRAADLIEQQLSPEQLARLHGQARLKIGAHGVRLATRLAREKKPMDASTVLDTALGDLLDPETLAQAQALRAQLDDDADR